MSDAFSLPQTLILTPDHGFDQVREALATVGLQLADDNDRPNRRVTFAHDSGLTAAYRSHDDFGLGLLHFARVPPRVRAFLAGRLPWLPRADLAGWLKSSDTQQQKFALCAALADERIDLLDDVGALAESAARPADGIDQDAFWAASSAFTVPVLAAAVARRLAGLSSAHAETVSGTRQLAEHVLPVIASLRDDALREEIQVSKEQCSLLFEPYIAERIPIEHHSWLIASTFDAQPAGPENVFAAPAAMFCSSNSTTDQFPRAYRTLAGWMKPEPIWFAWTAELPSGRQVRVDGLVYVDGEWLFFPRPWKLVMSLLPMGQPGWKP